MGRRVFGVFDDKLDISLQDILIFGKPQKY
jgi:hypothetical protein